MKITNMLLVLSLISCGRNATFSTVDVPPPCSVVSTSEGTTIVCGNTDTFIPNGTDGADGVDGINGQDAVIEVIAPCNDPYNEVLIRMSDGTVIGHYSGGTVNKQALVVLTPGAYVTTGRGNSCHFVIGPAPAFEVIF